MAVEGSDLAHPQDAVGVQGCQLVALAQWLCLHWGSHLVLDAPTPAICGRRGGETLEAAGGQEDEVGEACGLDGLPLLSFR